MLVVALGGMLPVRAQDGPRPPITAENVEQLEQLAMLGRGWVRVVAWSPDGETLAVGSSGGIWLYSAENLGATPRLLEGHMATIYSVAWSLDGTLLASGSGDGTVRIWDAVTGESLHVL
jgi:WD40 repeat protein